MNKIVYHGSPYGNIDKLIAQKSTHQKLCIYATDNRTIALIFIGKGKGDLDTDISSEDGHIVLVERRPGILKELYDKEGFLYELDGSTFDHYDYIWSQEVISFCPSITPLRKTRIPNTLKALCEEEKKGNLTIYRYPDRPKRLPLDNSDLIAKYIRFENSGLTGAISDLLEVYPEFEKLVKEKLENTSKQIYNNGKEEGKTVQEYKEHEIKILDVDIETLTTKLEAIGARKVYDDNRTIIAIDTKDKKYLNECDKLIRVTDEGSIKVTMHVNQSKPEIKEGIKFKTSRMKETMDFFHEMGLDPISKVTAHRVSYELGKIDFDIDKFPAIPAFLEIDIEHIEDEGYTVDSLLEALDLQNNRLVVMGTEDIHKEYGIDYFEEYKAE